MRRHSAAQRRQASAQALQWSRSCLSHSSAQASQAIAHSSQNLAAKRLPRDINRAAIRHRSAQSRSNRMHSAISCILGSRRQALAQCSHASAHSSHARMQSTNCSWGMRVLQSPGRVAASSEPRGGQHLDDTFTNGPSLLDCVFPHCEADLSPRDGLGHEGTQGSVKVCDFSARLNRAPSRRAHIAPERAIEVSVDWVSSSAANESRSSAAGTASR